MRYRSGIRGRGVLMVLVMVTAVVEQRLGSGGRRDSEVRTPCDVSLACEDAVSHPSAIWSRSDFEFTLVGAERDSEGGAKPTHVAAGIVPGIDYSPVPSVGADGMDDDPPGEMCCCGPDKICRKKPDCDGMTRIPCPCGPEACEGGPVAPSSELFAYVK